MKGKTKTKRTGKKRGEFKEYHLVRQITKKGGMDTF
jgi:hypothetical protein